MAKHPNKKIKWKLKNIYNWCYNKWMRWRKHTPVTFNFRTNSYDYEKRTDLDREVREQETGPAHELVGYKKKPLKKQLWWHTEGYHEHCELEAGRQKALKALREDKEDEHLIRRTL